MCAFALRRLDGRVKVYSEGDPWYAAALEFALTMSCGDLCLKSIVCFSMLMYCVL